MVLIPKYISGGSGGLEAKMPSGYKRYSAKTRNEKPIHKIFVSGNC